MSWSELVESGFSTNFRLEIDTRNVEISASVCNCSAIGRNETDYESRLRDVYNELRGVHVACSVTKNRETYLSPI